MQCVYSSPTPAEAHLVHDYLVQAGLQAVIQGGELAGLQGLVPTTETYASVWVSDEAYAQAEELVQEFLNSQPVVGDGTPWQCPNCGEEIEPQFTDCWNCGTSRIAPDA